jgi:hypothetical protein
VFRRDSNRPLLQSRALTTEPTSSVLLSFNINIGSGHGYLEYFGCQWILWSIKWFCPLTWIRITKPPNLRLKSDMTSTEDKKFWEELTAYFSFTASWISASQRPSLPSHYSRFQALCRIVPSIRLPVPSSLQAYCHFFFSEGVSVTSMIALAKGTATSYWSRRFFWFGGRPAFIPIRLGLALL